MFHEKCVTTKESQYHFIVHNCLIILDEGQHISDDLPAI